MMRPTVPSSPTPPRPYLAVPAAMPALAFAEAFDLFERKADIAAVLLRMPIAEPRALIDRVKAFAPAIQGAGAALLLDSHADLVARSGADGAHLAGIYEMQQALQHLKPQRIAGVGKLESRHDAMTAGEAGADYVMFGDPDAQDERPSTATIAERVAWWAEVFEIPCVAYATSLEECAEFAAAGADFVLIENIVWNDARGAGTALMEAMAAIGQDHRIVPRTADAVT